MVLAKLYRRRNNLSKYAWLKLVIYDELLFSVRIEYVAAMAKYIQNTMCSVCPLAVPLKANVKVGKTWGSLMPLEEYLKR